MLHLETQRNREFPCSSTNNCQSYLNPLNGKETLLAAARVMQGFSPAITASRAVAKPAGLGVHQGCHDACGREGRAAHDHTVLQDTMLGRQAASSEREGQQCSSSCCCRMQQAGVQRAPPLGLAAPAAPAACSCYAAGPAGGGRGASQLVGAGGFEVPQPWQPPGADWRQAGDEAGGEGPGITQLASWASST